MPSCPLVTIGIPTYNRRSLLMRALASARSQSHSNLEIVVSDDGSSDGTPNEVMTITDERVRLLTHARNVGMFGNMNACLDAARGAYFLMLSDDDYLEPRCIERLLAALVLYPSATLSYGQWWYHSGTGRSLQVSLGPALEDGFAYASGYWRGERKTILHGVLFRTDVLRALGGVPAGFAQDSLMTLRAALMGAVAHVPEPVTHYCLQPGSTTHSLSLPRLIRDRAALLENTLTTARLQGVAPAAVAHLERHARGRLATEASIGLIAMRRQVGRAEVLQCFRELYDVLSYRRVRSAIAVAIALMVPRVAVTMLRRRSSIR